MNAYLGMRVTEWEDGQVNIGIAVCPTKRKSAPVIGCYWTRDTLLSNSDNDGDYILPKSAFIMRPATSHRHKSRDASRDTGFNITYATQNGTSDLGIMLASTSSTQDQEQDQGEELSRSWVASSSTDGEGDNMKVLEPEASDGLVDSASSELELQEVKKSLEKEAGEISEDLGVPQPTQIIVSKVSSDESGDSSTEKGSTEEKVSLRKQPGAGTHYSGMKRVSWLEDIEKFSEGEREKASRNNSKENKRESVRKSNGGGGGGGKSSSRSPTKKQHQQHGFNSDDANYREGYKAGKRNSGDKSRIPVIASGGDYQPTSCEFYRRQMLRECCLHEDNSPPPTLADNWYGYTSLQKYAGQKVVKKFAAEQKRLEEDMSNRRKTEIWILGSDLDDFVITSPNVPIRKKTTRLRPIQI